MNKIIKSKYAILFFTGLALIIVCAWFSTGFYHVDEYYQVLAFSSCKLGTTPAGIMAWEFQQKLRASFLPDIAYLLAKIMNWFGVYNPFTLSFILRLLAGIANWFIICKLCLLLSQKIKTAKGKELLILMSLFLWFVPYITVRYTAENISGAALMYGLYYILKSEEESKSPVLYYFVAGLFFGVSAFLRCPLIISVAGLIAWLIWVKKIQWKYIYILAFSGTIAIGINVLIDCWFYGGYTFTLLNFIKVYIHHSSPEMGATPVKYFFISFFRLITPPLSLVLFVALFAGIYKNRKDPLIWVLVPFAVIHCIIRHKEFRFLFPVTFIFIYISVLGIDFFLSKKYYQKIHRYVYATMLLIYIPLLLVRTLIPANVEVNYYKYLYNNYSVENTTIFCLHNEYYCTIYEGKAFFYGNPNLKTVKIDSTAQIRKYLNINHPESALFLCRPKITDGLNIQGYKTEMVYSFLPSLNLNYKVNTWLMTQLSAEQNMPFWRIYQFSRI